jgi:glycosyltransferase involved in cell wall biosynthesis
VRRADLILADSNASRRDAIKVLGVPPTRVQTVYLGMEEHSEYSPEQLAEVRARHGLPEQYAFYLGGFDKRKNVPLLLKAWRESLSRMEGEPVLAIGGEVPKPGGVFPDVRGEAMRLGFGEDGAGGPVRFLGRVSEEEKPLLMSAARLFVYPSVYEGFGLDPLEAMAVGCPVISSCGGSLAEVVGDAGLLVPPNDLAATVEAVVCAWNSPPLRADLSRRGRLRARRFTWQRSAEQTLAFYRKFSVQSSKLKARGS